MRERTAEQTTTKEFNFSRRLHKDGPIERYQVVLGLDGKELCLAAEEVLGIETLDQYRFTKLEESVLNERNRYLKAVIQNKNEAYPFEAAFLLEPSFCIWRWRRQMKWQTARNGDEIYALEKKKLITLVMDPLISEIPETNDNIRGISFYQDKAVVFYQTDQQRPGRIGVLLANEPSILNGILVEEILGEIEELDENAKGIAPGLWVMKCD